MIISIEVKSGNPVKIFGDLENMLKNTVYKLEMKTDTKTITSEKI